MTDTCLPATEGDPPRAGWSWLRARIASRWPRRVAEPLPQDPHLRRDIGLPAPHRPTSWRDLTAWLP